MPNHPPKSKNTQTHYVSLESLFLLLDSNKNQITSDLTFKQAQEITNHIPSSVIKFQKMEASKAVQHLSYKKHTCSSYKLPAQTAECSHTTMGEMMVSLPNLLETAISCLLQDFDYESNKDSNIAVAIRVLAATADRFEVVFRRNS